jgi:hypothetical protein
LTFVFGCVLTSKALNFCIHLHGGMLTPPSHLYKLYGCHCGTHKWHSLKDLWVPNLWAIAGHVELQVWQWRSWNAQLSKDMGHCNLWSFVGVFHILTYISVNFPMMCKLCIFEDGFIWNLFEFSAAEITWKFNIFHILNSNLTK